MMWFLDLLFESYFLYCIHVPANAMNNAFIIYNSLVLHVRSWDRFSFCFFFQAKFTVNKINDQESGSERCIIECEGIGMTNPSIWYLKCIYAKTVEAVYCPVLWGIVILVTVSCEIQIYKNKYWIAIQLFFLLCIHCCRKRSELVKKSQN